MGQMCCAGIAVCQQRLAHGAPEDLGITVGAHEAAREIDEGAIAGRFGSFNLHPKTPPLKLLQPSVSRIGCRSPWSSAPLAADGFPAFERIQAMAGWALFLAGRHRVLAFRAVTVYRHRGGFPLGVIKCAKGGVIYPGNPLKWQADTLDDSGTTVRLDSRGFPTHLPQVRFLPGASTKSRRGGLVWTTPSLLLGGGICLRFSSGSLETF
jgi:hypothetical protein